MRFLFILCVLLTQSAFAAEGGHDVGNGGDSFVIVIQKMAENLAAEMDKMPAECAAKLPVSPTAFRTILQRASLESSVDPLYLEVNSRRVFKEAINYPSSSVIVFHRDSFRQSEAKETLVLHEFFGLLSVNDQFYKSSQLTIDILRNPSCKESSPAAIESGLPAGFAPGAMAMDGNGILYLVDNSEKKIYRYDTTTATLLPSWPLRYHVEKLAYAKSLQRLYLGSNENKITYFDLKNTGREQNFATVPNTIRAMVARGRSLIVQPERGNTWSNLYLFDAAGIFYQDRDWVFTTDALAVDELDTKLFFVTAGVSPTSMYRLRFSGEKLQSFGEDGRFGAAAQYPAMAAGKRLIALGSGEVVDIESLTRFGSVPAFVGAVWSRERLVTATVEMERITVRRWDDKFFEESTTALQGSFYGIFQHAGTVTVLYRNPDGNLSIEKIK